VSKKHSHPLENRLFEFILDQLTIGVIFRILAIVQPWKWNPSKANHC